MVRQYMEVRLTVIGSSPAWPNPGSAQSGYLVEGDRPLLLDCGPGVLGRLRELELYPRSIAITHFHLDHWGDLVPWVWGALAGPGATLEKPELLAPPGGRERLADLAVIERHIEVDTDEYSFAAEFQVEQFSHHVFSVP